MATFRSDTSLTGNRLLDHLPQIERQQVLQDSERVTLESGQYVYIKQEPIQFVYFPIDTILSSIVTLQNGFTVEVSTIGNEGIAGLPVFLDSEIAVHEAQVQVSGTAIRIDAAAFKRCIHPDSVLLILLKRYTQAVLAQTSQLVACNLQHLIEARFCRWLLMIQDRVGPQFNLTQEFVAEMLGVRRASISEAASALQRAELIRYRRGEVTILNRQGLEQMTCECYFAMRHAMHQVLDQPDIAEAREADDEG